MLYSLLIIILAPLLSGIFLIVFPSLTSTRLILLPAILVFGLGLLLWKNILDSGAQIIELTWLPILGISANLRADLLGALFVLLISSVGLAVFQYSRYYFKNPPSNFYWSGMLIFMGSMLGLVLSDSLILMFIFWELTTIMSALLIAFDHTDEKARRGGIQAFLVTGLGGLSLLSGIILLGQLGGTYNFSELLLKSKELTNDHQHIFPLILIFIGAFSKSAQWPFHFWLPGAMAAQAPISAFLHSATLVNAGVFLLARLAPILGNSPIWYPTLMSVGTITFCVGSWFSFRALDLKMLLANSTVAYLGVLTTLYATVGSHTEIHRGELLHFTNHALYKSALFLLLGWFEKLTGTRDISRLDDQHWMPRRPWGALLFGIGAMAMIGGPFLLAFQSKKIFFEKVIEGARTPLFFSLAAFLASAVTVATALKMFIAPFFGKIKPPIQTEPSYWLLLIPTLLLAPQLVGGLVPDWFLGTVLEPASEWPSGISFWKKLDLSLAVTLLMFFLGIVLFLFWRPISYLSELNISKKLVNEVITKILKYCHFIGQFVQSGGYPRYIFIIWLCVLPICAFIFVKIPDLQLSWHRGWIPSLGVFTGCLGAVILSQRVAKVILMAFAGYALVLFFTFYRAPDLALTQVLIETILLVLLLLAFRHLPNLIDDKRSSYQKRIHLTLAIVCGLLVGWLTLLASSEQSLKPTELFAQLTRSEAFGKNIVNVILVDFRAADTLGEIAVLVIAALGIRQILRAQNRSKGPS